MSLNITQASHLIDKVLTKEEREFLIEAWNGIALPNGTNKKEVNEKVLKRLTDLGLVTKAPFSNPRANIALEGVVVTEDGVTLYNALAFHTGVQNNGEIVETEYDRKPVATKVAVGGISEPEITLDAVEKTLNKGSTVNQVDDKTEKKTPKAS